MCRLFLFSELKTGVIKVRPEASSFCFLHFPGKPASRLTKFPLTQSEKIIADSGRRPVFVLLSSLFQPVVTICQLTADSLSEITKDSRFPKAKPAKRRRLFFFSPAPYSITHRSHLSSGENRTHISLKLIITRSCRVNVGKPSQQSY